MNCTMKAETRPFGKDTPAAPLTPESLAAQCWEELELEFQRVPTRREKRVIPSISEFPGVLRLPKRNYDVPTFDQLYRAEKLYLLRTCGYGCFEFEGKDPLKIVESAEALYGRCKYFTALKCSIVHRRILRKQAREKKRADHELRQKLWIAGGQAAHYRAKHMFGNTSHHWFARGLVAETGMDVHSSIVSACSWEPESALEDFVRAPKARWNRSSEKSDDSQAPDGKYGERSVRRCYSRPTPVRSVMLLTKLRAYIRALRTAPMAVWNCPVGDVKYTRWNVCHPQMEGATGESPVSLTTGNVVLTETNSSSSTVASRPQFRYDWHQLCSSEVDTNYSYLTDRFTFYKSFEWKSSYVKGTSITLGAMNLPVDFVSSVPADGSMPMFVPFRIFKYYRSDIEIKIHVNSNPFQVGQLQFAWQYLEKYDGNKLDNMYLRSQLPHVVVNAAASNEATLYIPYKFVQPYMSTTQVKKGLDKLYLGTLRVFVVSPLAVGTGGPDHCSVSYFIRFPNAQFTGMRDGGIADPQMEGVAAAMVATAVVDRVIGDRNCDNRSDNVNPNYLVPTGTHSWSAGTGLQERLHSLRLDNSTLGVGRVGIDNSETSIGIPCRIFGMLNHIEWSTKSKTKNVKGAMLWSCDAHAQLQNDVFFKEVSENALDTYSLPPTCVVAGLFRQWRGSLEFKFDFIIGKYHTGRVLCAYIPGFYGDASDITLEQARNSPNVEFDLASSTSFTFVVPYISDKVFWPRKYTGPHKYSENNAPSKLVLFVLNPLIPMQSVVDTVTIVPYFRAGVDFEVSVPVQPSIGLSDNIYMSTALKDKIYPTDGSYPYRATNYKGFGDDKKYILYEGTAAFGTASTFHAPEESAEETEYFYGKAENSAKQPTMKFISKEDGKEYNSYVSFIVLWYVEGKGNYGIPFPSRGEGEKQADKVAMMLKQKKPLAEILKECYDYIDDGIPGSSNLVDLRFAPVYKKYTKLLESFEVVEPQMEDQRVVSDNTLAPTGVLPSTSCGVFNFNENFSDLKDLARRYQLYCDNDIKLPKEYHGDNTLALFPVLPHGLELDVHDPGSLFNLCRDGHIPIISSGYIYFRGSIRMRIVLSSDAMNAGGLKCWVQHHPDGECTKRRVQIYPNIKEHDQFKSHTYSFYIQPMSINSVIEFEVPFYQSGMYGITRKPADSNVGEVCQYYSLGNILVGAFTDKLDKPIGINFKVYYSISDDFSFSTFRGFPRMVYTDAVWAPIKETKKKEIVWITGEPQMEEAQPQMMAAIKNYFVQDTVTSVRAEVVAQAQASISAEVERVQLKFHKALNNSSKFIVNVPTVTAALGNLAHVIANPTPKTIGISIANVIVAMLGQTVTHALKIIEAVVAVISDYWHRFVGGDSSAPPQGETESKSLHSMYGLIFTVVSSLVGVSVSSPKYFPDVLRNINGGVSLYNNSVRLIQNSADLIGYCISFVCAKLNPESALASRLMNCVPEIQDWYKECCYLLDVRNKAKFLYDNSMVTRVFDAGVTGNLLVSSGLTKSHPGGKIVFDTHKEIRKLQVDLVERGKHPDVRFETWPIWLYGEPGIGKSFLVDRLVNDLLKSVNFQQSGSLIYYIPSGAKYWSGCQNPAALVSDDLFQVNGTKLEEEIANMFLICSTSVLNPPMAAVEEKERRINPLLYVMLCNHEFPNLSPTCRTPEAVYRRRKYLLTARLKEEYRTPDFVDASQLPRDVLANMDHLEFKYKFNPKVVEGGHSEWLSYKDLLAILQPAFRTHYENERTNFKARMRNMYSLDPNYNEDNLYDNIPELQDNVISLSEQIAIYKERIQNEIDDYNDPRRPLDVWDWIVKAQNKFADLRAKFQIGPQEAESISSCEEITESLVSQTFGSTFLKSALEQQFPSLYLYQRDRFSKIIARSDNYLSDYLPTLDQFPVFFGSLCADMAENELFMSDKFNSLTCLDKIELNTFFVSQMKQFIDLGNFNIFESLKFFSMFNFGHEVWADFLYGIPQENECSLGMDPYAEEDTLTHSVVSDKSLYHNVEKKKSLRSGLLSNSIPRPREFCLNLLRYLCRKLILDLPLPATVRAVFCSLEFDLSPFTILSNLRRVIAEFLKLDNREITGVMQSVLHAHFKLIASILICEHLILPYDHDCRKFRTFNHFREKIHLVQFCSSRRLLELVNSELIMCDNASCMFHNPMYYYFLAIAAVGCGKWTEAYWDSFGRMNFVPCEFTDVYRALRKRTQTLSDNIFCRLGRYLQHIFFHFIPEVLSGIYNAVCKHLPKILIFLTLSTGAIMARSAFSATMGTSDIIQQSTLNKQGNYFKFDAPRVPTNNKVPVAVKLFGSPQMSSGNRKVLSSKIENNTVLLHVTWVEDGVSQVRACRNLMIKGRAMLVLRHYWEEYQYIIDQGFKINCFLFFGKNDRIVKIPIPWEDLQKVAWCSSSSDKLTSNYGIVDLPRYVPEFKNIVSRFASQAEHQNVPSFCDLLVVNGSSSFDIPLTVKNSFMVAGTSCSSAVYMDRVYSYNKQYKGMCGSVVVAPTLGSGLGAIIGLHVAGSETSGVGYAEPIYREMFDIFFNEFPQREVMPLPLSEDIQPEFELDSNLMMYGCVPPQFAHKESGKTKIIPSKLHGVIYPVATEVNPLKPNDPRQPPGSHPLRDGCNKHGTGDVRAFAPALVSVVKDHMADKFQQIVRPIRAEVKPLTMQQAVCGDVNVPYFDSLKWKSSEGFPLSSHRPKSAHDKKWLFELTEGSFGYELKKLHPLLDQQLRLRNSCFEKGIKPPTIYVDCLKDYRLSPEKCKIPGKTRIFSIAPVQCSIDIRVHMNDFCASIKNSRIKNSIGIGINPDSLEWTNLVNYLFEVGNKIVTLDYSNYGPSLMSQLVAASNEVITDWHRYHGASEEHVKRVEWLLDCDILNPVHLSSNLVYQTVNGISSGSPLTGECNSIPNLFYIRLTYLEIMNEHLPEFASMYYFDRFVRLIVYGDDLIMSVDDNIAEIFNAITIRDYLAKHGIKVTSAQKDSEMVPYTSIYEATFLKRSFKEHPFRKGVWLGPIERQSVTECLNWIHSCEDLQEATLESCRASLDLAYSQGPKFFKEHYNKIKRALNDIGLTIECKTWHERDQEIFGKSADSNEPAKIKIDLPWTYALSEQTLE
ncbi:polyprotein [Scaphoideus titanus iflavirus 1]|nr:polyprotein [Scaphoideus titanus iflavirus 1]